MNFELSDEQQQLADSLSKYLNNEYGFEQRKAILQSPSGLSDKAWAAFAEMGLTAIALPEADGGFGGGATDLMAPMEAFGEALSWSPCSTTWPWQGVWWPSWAVPRSAPLGCRV